MRVPPIIKSAGMLLLMLAMTVGIVIAAFVAIIVYVLTLGYVNLFTKWEEST